MDIKRVQEARELLNLKYNYTLDELKKNYNSKIRRGFVEYQNEREKLNVTMAER